MNKRFVTNILLAVLIIGVFFPIGAAVYADQTTGTTSTQTSTITPSDIVILDEVKNKIKESDPDNYDKNITNYTNLLINLNVHDKFKTEIENLVIDGHKLPDILIAYQFLYHEFGFSSEIEPMVIKKETGETWETIFKEYHAINPRFVPTNFDPDYLENLMNHQDLTSDDIMIADWASFRTKKPFDEIINSVLAIHDWKEINAQLDILFSNATLPRVQITKEQLDNNTKSFGLTEQQVVEAFVLANKVNEIPKNILQMEKDGYSEEAIMDKSYSNEYY